MKYKYYIYKQSNLTNFNKYDLDEYSLLREITQMTQWSIKIERDSEWFTVMRRKFSGEITIKGVDFDTLIATEGDVKQYAIIIHRECAGVYTEFWKGFFSYFDFKVDLDRCYLSFEPTVWDKYSPVYDQLPIDRNAVAADSDFIIRADGYEFPTETMPWWTLAFGPPPAASWTEHPDYPGELYYMYSQTCISQGYVSGSILYTIDRIYKRNYYWMPDNITAPSLDPTWIALEENSVGEWKWIRPYEGHTVGTATYNLTVIGMDRYEILNTTASETILLTGCKRLSKILEFFAAFFDLTYVSDFFNDDPCPMGGPTLDWTILQQISNLRATEDPATKGMMTLKWLLTQIKDTFNVYWYIDSNGDFRLEHRRYFDNGKSYSYTHVIELDIHTTYPTQTLKLNRYEWSKPDLYRFEKLEIPYSLFDDWVDASFEYPQLSILGNETNTRTVEWGTDLISMYDSRDELPKQGWVLLNVNLVGPLYKVINTIGAVTGSAFQNARFSQGNLYRDLWTWGRLLPTGKINGGNVTLDSVEKLRKQVELSIPQCCEDWDYEGLYRTELGDGWIESGEYEAKTGNLKLNLMYE